MAPDLQFVMALTGEPIAATQAVGRRVRRGGPIDHAQALLVMEDDLVASLVASRAGAAHVRRLWVTTTTAEIVADLDTRVIEAVPTTSKVGRHESIAQRIELPYEDATVVQAAAFLRSHERRTSPDVGIGQAIACREGGVGDRQADRVDRASAGDAPPAAGGVGFVRRCAGVWAFSSGVGRACDVFCRHQGRESRSAPRGASPSSVHAGRGECGAKIRHRTTLDDIEPAMYAGSMSLGGVRRMTSANRPTSRARADDGPAPRGADRPLTPSVPTDRAAQDDRRPHSRAMTHCLRRPLPAAPRATSAAGPAPAPAAPAGRGGCARPRWRRARVEPPRTSSAEVSCAADPSQ